MTLELANTVAMGLGAYFAAGLVVALIYALGGAGKIDPDAKGMPIQARLIIMPGVMALWPLMAWKLIVQSEPAAS